MRIGGLASGIDTDSIPGAIVTMILLGILTSGNAVELAGDYPFDWES